MPDVYLSIGSNIEREKNVPSALEALQQQFGKLKLSSVYETEAVGFDGPPFFNLVCQFDSNHDIRSLAKNMREIEISHGRTLKSVKFSGRTLDLDILLYGDLVFNEGKIRIPRDDIIRYAFVLEPLAEIAPDLKHPLTGESYLEMWRKFDKRGLEQKIVPPMW